ncbi:MAG: PQQ-binding-like beta-propeller repeat protein, partial [Mycobacteriales bacterium]
QQAPNPQQPTQQQPGGWSEQPTTQWTGPQPGAWQDPATAGQRQYGAPPGPPGGPPYYPPPAGGGSSGSKATLWIIGGAVALVVVVVIAVVGVIAMRGGNNPDPTPTNSFGQPVAKAATKVLWTLPDPPGSDIKGANKLSGLWLSDDSVVRATILGLTAYDLGTGKQQWSRPVPSGSSVCQMSPTLVNGLGAVIYGQTLSSGAKCDRLMTVDAKSGDKKWDISLHQSTDPARDYSDSFTSVSIASDVVVAQNADAVRGYSISDGARKWGVVPKGGTTSNCKPINSLAEGDLAVIVLDCLSNKGSVSLINAVTGKINWTHATAATEGDPLFMDPISVKPVVVVSKSIGGRAQVLTFDDSSGSLKQQITSTVVGGTSELDFDADGSRLDGQTFKRVVVNGGKLFAASRGAAGARHNEIVAVDLDTGKVSWTSAAATDTRESIIKVDDQGVLALNQGAYNKLPRLVRYDASTGKGKNGVTIPESLRDGLYNMHAFVQGNRIVLVNQRAAPDQPPLVVLGE